MRQHLVYTERASPPEATLPLPRECSTRSTDCPTVLLPSKIALRPATNCDPDWRSIVPARRGTRFPLNMRLTQGLRRFQMEVQFILTGMAALAAMVAGALWLISARTKLPISIRQIDMGSLTDADSKAEDDMDRLTNGLRQQAKWSAAAAWFASAAAFLQSVSWLIDLCSTASLT